MNAFKGIGLLAAIIINDELSRIWYYGAGGSGKTASAFHYTRNYRTYKCDLINKGWFDGYDNHEAVIIDDFNPDPNDKELFKLLLSLLDKYPLRVNVKGASVNWNPKDSSNITKTTLGILWKPNAVQK